MVSSKRYDGVCISHLKTNMEESILVKPKIIGEIYAQDMKRFQENPGDMLEVLGDMFVNLKHGNVDGTGSNLQILQGDMEILNCLFIGCGLPAQNKAQVVANCY